METEFVGVSEADTLGGVARLLISEDADTAVVLRGNDPVGELSARDALAALLNGSDPEETPVSEAMSEAPTTIRGRAALREAEERLVSEANGGLLVVDEGEPVGVLTERGLLTALAADARNGQARDSVELTLEHDGEAEYATQSICEECGGLTQELEEANGQLICPNCRGV